MADQPDRSNSRLALVALALAVIGIGITVISSVFPLPGGVALLFARLLGLLLTIGGIMLLLMALKVSEFVSLPWRRRKAAAIEREAESKHQEQEAIKREARRKRHADYCPSPDNDHRHMWQRGDTTRQCKLCFATEDLPATQGHS